MVKKKENKSKGLEERVLKTLKKKISSKKVPKKRILKKSKITLHLQEKEFPSILGSGNKFFKDEWEETKRSMF